MKKLIGILLKPSDIPDLDKFLNRLCDEIIARDHDIIFEDSQEKRVTSFLNNSNRFSFCCKQKLLMSSSMIFSLGGDGTLIGACRDSAHFQKPIVGINLGRLGFMTEFTMDEIFDHLDCIFKNEYVCSKVDIYLAQIIRNNKEIVRAKFANDAVIAKGGIARMFELSVRTEFESIYKLIGDGLIISSSIGSTAYSMAAGGPILHRDVSGIILTPICPHSLTKRPLVLPDSTILTIKQTRDASELTLTIDGQEVFDLNQNDEIKISKTEHHVELILNPNRGFFKTLRDKFANSTRDM